MDLLEDVRWIFDTSTFTPPGGWSIPMRVFVRLFNFCMGIAYCSASITFLLIFRDRIRHLQFPGLTFLVISACFMCGLTHFFDGIVFWWPAYRFSLIIDCLAALIAIPVLFAFPGVASYLHEMPTKRELQDANKILAEEIDRLEQCRARAQVGVESLDSVLRELGVKDQRARKSMEALHVYIIGTRP